MLGDSNWKSYEQSCKVNEFIFDHVAHVSRSRLLKYRKHIANASKVLQAQEDEFMQILHPQKISEN